MGRASSASSNSRSRSSSERGRHPTKDKASKKAKKDKKEARRRRRDRGPGSPDTASDEVAGGGAPAGAAAASTPLTVALPTDNSVLSIDFVNSLANSINGLTSAMKEVQLGMKAMQRESREQREHIADIVTELQSMKTMVQTNNQKYETAMAALNTDIKTKLEQMKAASAHRGPAVPSPSASSSGSAAAQAAPPTGGGPPARLAHRPSRLWLKGFAETLTTKALCHFADAAVAQLPDDLQAGAKAGAPGFGAVVFIDFPPAAPIATIKQHLTDMKLKHKQENGDIKDIRVTNDMPIPVRYKAKVLGELWQKVRTHLDKLPAGERPDPIQLSNNNGKLYIVIGSRPQELFVTVIDPQGNMQVNAKNSNLMKYKITNEMADAWIVDAVASAARFAPK
jgi:hypothetical protein